MDGNKLEAGFTLIEVLISLVVLLVGMLGVMGMQYYAISGSASSREMRTATAFSQDLIEQLKTTPYSLLSSGSDSTSEDPAMSGNIKYDRAWTVVSNCMGLVNDGNSFPPTASCATVPDSSSASSVSAVRVRTRWMDKNGDYHYVTLDTLRWDEDATP